MCRFLIKMTCFGAYAMMREIAALTDTLLRAAEIVWYLTHTRAGNFRGVCPIIGRLRNVGEPSCGFIAAVSRSIPDFFKGWHETHGVVYRISHPNAGNFGRTRDKSVF